MDNPWISRFSELTELDEIERRAYIPAQPLCDLAKLPTDTAIELLRKGLERIYVPTKQHCKILKRLIEVAQGHAILSYPNRRTMLEVAYRDIFKSNPQPAICLTGLAGVGKSSLINALSRVLPADDFIDIDESHRGFPLRSALQVEVGSRSGLKPILTQLCAENFPTEGCAKTNEVAVQLLAKKAYLTGVSILTADEFQFLTQSSTANAKITEILLALRDIGLPFVYVGNYSLGHRLMNRNDEDKQRLCSQPIFLDPELPASEDFRRQLQEILNVAPDLLAFDPDLDSEKIYLFSAGAIRRVIMLVTIAARYVLDNDLEKVTISEVEIAYNSSDYFAMRQVVQDIARQMVTGKDDKSRKDLCCPYPRPKTIRATQSERWKNEQEKRAALELVHSSATVQEKSGYSRLVKSLKPASTAPSRTKRKSKKSVSKDEMLKGILKLKDDL